MMAAATLAQPAAAQAQQQTDWCINASHGFSFDQQISGCTLAIESGKWSGQGLAWAFNNRGFAYYLKGELDRAYADLDKAIQLDPKDAEAFNNRGLVFYAKDDSDRAIAEFNESIRLDPRNIFAFTNRGAVYQAKDDYDRAIADYSEAIRLDPTFAVAFNARGNANRHKGDLDRAITDYSEAIRLNSKYDVAFYGRGIAYQAKGDLDQAIADYTEVIRLDPKLVMAFNNRGNAYHANGEVDHAMADYTEAIRLDPKNFGTYFNRGHAAIYSGSLPQALADLNQSIELNPKYAFAALWRDIADRRSNLASRLAQAVAQINMTRWPAPLIRLYLGQMTPEAARAAADDPDASKKQRQVCDANFFTGELALLRGAKDEAIGLFRLAAADCQKNTNLWADAKAELKTLGAQP